jgi:PhzF family phenazine biosynthesis protein
MSFAVKLYQVDAFADKLFAGNPAAVCPLDSWLPDALMQQIAGENNLSETAFFVREGEGYHIRWFTPRTEVDLCGHATLASAHVLFHHLGYTAEKILLTSKSGPLYVTRRDDLICLDFPAASYHRVDPPSELVDGIGLIPIDTYQSTDYLVLLDSEKEVREASPDFSLLARLDIRGIIITAEGETADFVSRFFAPGAGIDEDPVTGSSHTFLVPFWSEKLGKTEFTAKQLSGRGGTLYCRLLGDRVEISGRALTYMIGELSLG